MSRSILQLYIDTAKTLMEYGPLSIQELAPFLKIEPSSLGERINFLADQGIIKERNNNSTATYSITKRGTEILRFFKVPTLVKVTVDKA